MIIFPFFFAPDATKKCRANEDKVAAALRRTVLSGSASSEASLDDEDLASYKEANRKRVTRRSRRPPRKYGDHYVNSASVAALWSSASSVASVAEADDDNSADNVSPTDKDHNTSDTTRQPMETTAHDKRGENNLLDEVELGPEHLCGVCGQRYRSSEEFLNHLQTHSKASSSPGGTCEICGKTFQNMLTHMRSHTGEKPYGCGVCGKSFPRPGALRRHKKIHSQTSACPVCGLTFKEHQLLLEHLSIHEKDDGPPQEGEVGRSPETEQELHHRRSGQLLSCRVCGDSFHSQGFLRKHAETHCRAPQSVCGVCGLQTDSPEALLSHLQAHRETSGACRICGRTFQNMKTHMRRHTGIKPYRCALCNKSFPRPGALRRHKKIHGSERPHACRLCGKTFLERSGLKTHSKSHDGEGRQSPARTEGGTEEGTKVSHSCKVCGESFNRKGSLRNHVKIHSSACGICGDALSPPDILAEHLRLHRDAGNICHICGKAYQNIDTHMRRHTGVKPFTCATCGKSYPRPGALRRHKRVHTGERPYVCEFCGKTFMDNGALVMHIRNHTGEKPAQRVSCDTCGKSLASAQVLEVHKRIHTGEKPFQCRVCGKAFRQVGGLNAHTLTHTGEKPFSCSLCPKSFSTKGYLETHIRFHKKECAFSCSLCWKAFVTKNDLKKHLLTHSGEKPYSCSVCAKSYQEKRSRDVHMKVHREPAGALAHIPPDFTQL